MKRGVEPVSTSFFNAYFVSYFVSYLCQKGMIWIKYNQLLSKILNVSKALKNQQPSNFVGDYWLCLKMLKKSKRRESNMSLRGYKPHGYGLSKRRFIFHFI